MSNGNNVTLVGNITRDPELRFTPTGQATASFGLAVNRRWQNRQTQEWEEATSFFDVVCWREMAENTSESLVRGSRVIVTGRLDQRSWENAEGERRSRWWPTRSVRACAGRPPRSPRTSAGVPAATAGREEVGAAAPAPSAPVSPPGTTTVRSPSDAPRW